jgi:hypothetical protein
MSIVAPFFTADGPAGRWSVTVPVPDSERKHVNSADYGHLSGRFLTTWLRVHPSQRPQGQVVTYTLSGPNIRQDGTPGARTLSVSVTREYVEETFPATLETANQALAAGAEAVLANADMAAAEICRAIDGEAS